MKIVATITARMTSNRLPGKVMLPVLDRPILHYLVERLKNVPSIDNIVLATTVNKTDDTLIDFAINEGISYFRGSEDDVLLRVVEAADSVDADITKIIQMPFVNPLTGPIYVNGVSGDEAGLIKSFTITNGSDTEGGAIYINNSDLVIDNCVIIDNQGYYSIIHILSFCKLCNIANRSVYRDGRILSCWIKMFFAKMITVFLGIGKNFFDCQ